MGTNTALLDDPELTTRLWEGNSPIRLVLDMNLRLPLHLKLFDKKVKTIVFNNVKQEENENLIYYKIEKEKNIVSEISKALYQLNIQSVIVEGGAKLLQSFIDADLWDEARVMDKLVKIGGEGGLIALDAKGNIVLPFNSEGMYRASKKQNEDIFIGIYK